MPEDKPKPNPQPSLESLMADLERAQDELATLRFVLCKLADDNKIHWGPWLHRPQSRHNETALRYGIFDHSGILLRAVRVKQIKGCVMCTPIPIANVSNDDMLASGGEFTMLKLQFKKEEDAYRTSIKSK